MNRREITTLTRAMLHSGDVMPRCSDRIRVDKHSTGGLGDKVSLILAPLLAALDLEVPMISGRGLGLTGGTLDKLESIEGFQTELSSHDSQRILRDVGAVIIGASERIAPADRKLYALRDVTGTVESVALITASILSKKLAANLDALVMDVKTGSGAFMKTQQQATELAHSLVRVGRQAGLPTIAILSDMDQPLGETVGNALEVNEAIEVLRGDIDLSGGGGNVRRLSIELGAELMVQVNASTTLDEARCRLAEAIDRGFAMERLERMVHAQKGRLCYPLPVAPAHPIEAPNSGYLSGYDCRAIGEAVVAMGGGRRKTGDAIDHRVGVRVHGQIGQRVERGQPILTLHCHSGRQSNYLKTLESAVGISQEQAAPRSLILERFDQ
jgi:pyrimidine-nucleoside phosphorylase